MSDTPLKPCPVPWCASQHVTTRHYDAKRRQHWVECFKCNFKTPQMPSKTNAIAAWNTRQPTQNDALREALEAAPLIGATESVESFRTRQDVWLNGQCRAALEARGLEIRSKNDG